MVCFLDYSDFFSYNFPIGDHQPENVPRPALDVGEATRTIIMALVVTKVEPAEEDGSGFPVVHFKGLSRSLDRHLDENAFSDILGEHGVPMTDFPLCSLADAFVC